MRISSRHTKNGTFRKITCKTKAGNTIPCLLSRFGTSYYFEQSDIEVFLQEYPADRHGWFFNPSKDGYIAEHTPFGISVSPVFVHNHVAEVWL